MKKSIPPEVFALHTAVLGMTGSGKTSSAKLAVEQLHAEHGPKARICVLDPLKSDWWGITSSADGKRPGLPFHILGGPRGHVPLHEGAGKSIGELVATGALPLSIIDMADFGPGGPSRFFVDFAQALFRRIRGVVYLVMEEAHEFAPKERAGFEKENLALHWAKKIATGSRSKGIRLILCTQRTQSLHNALLGSCQALLAHRFTFAPDQEPVIKWIKGHVKKKDLVGVDLDESLADLDDGQALVSIGGRLQTIQFPKIRTFDNSATPEIGDADIEVKTAPVDVEKLRTIIGTAVAEAEANDPKKLKAELAAARKEIARLEAKTPAPAAAKPGTDRADKAARFALERRVATLTKALENAMKFITNITAQDFIKDGKVDQERLERAVKAAVDSASKQFEARLEEQRRLFEKWRAEGRKLSKGLETMLADGEVVVNVNVRHAESFDVSTPKAPAPARVARAPLNGVSRPQQKILDGLAWLKGLGIDRADRVRAAMLADQSPRSSGYEKNISTLRTAGLIEYPSQGELALTPEGEAQAAAPDIPGSDAALHEAIRRHVSGPQWTLLEVLIGIYPQAVKREDLADRADVSAASSGFEKNVSTLRSLGFIDYPSQGHVAAQSVLFIN